MKNQKGISLIEVTIGLAIAAAGATALASMLGNQATSVSTLEYKVKVMEMRSLLLNQVFTDGSSCSCLFSQALPAEFPAAGISGRLSTSTPITRLGLFNFSTLGDCSTATMPRPVLSNTFEDSIRTSDVYLSDLQPLGTDRFVGKLAVEIESQKKVLGSKKKLLKIPVVVQTVAGTNPGDVKFSSCSMGGEITKQLQAALAQTTTHEQRVCYRDNNMHNITVTCPPSKALIACSGGPGDLDESHEGSWIIPDYATNTCTLTVKNARCVSGEPWTEQRVIAACYQL